MVAIRVVKQDREGWLTRHLPGPESEPPASPNAALIEARMQLTQATGKHLLWEGYARVPGYAKSTRRPRSSNQVRTTAVTGAFYSWLVAAFGARQVEFGTAFGVSGTHWLTGLAATGGPLFTYEPKRSGARWRWTTWRRSHLRSRRWRGPSRKTPPQPCSLAASTSDSSTRSTPARSSTASSRFCGATCARVGSCCSTTSTSPRT